MKNYKLIAFCLAIISFFFIASSFTYINNSSYSNNSKTNEVLTQDEQYKNGWKDGFCEGWKDVKGPYAYCPYPPYPPYPKYECNKGYKCGYNRGFKFGMCQAKGNSCTK
jgi:hypothetical protein